MFFDESAVNVVDSWLKAAGGAEEAPKPKKAAKKSTPTAPPADVGGRKGLGYTAPAKKSKSQTEEAVDKVMKNIQKQKKKAVPENEQHEAHGLVEEEITRFKAVSPSTGVPLNDKKSAPVPAAAGAQQSHGFSKQAGPHQNKKPAFDMNKKKDSFTVQTKWGSHNENDNVKKRPLDGDGGAADAAENSRVRKRTKTRSKQKNIRRDRRTEEFKPEHLRLDSEEYCGYDLTEVFFISLLLFSHFAYCICTLLFPILQETKGKLGILKK
jgi:hypothetical protein